jgi:hypothetical protein
MTARKELDGHLRNRLLASIPANDYALVEPNLQSTAGLHRVARERSGVAARGASAAAEQ